MKFSLVLPVYNVERYLSKCIESCLNQDLDYEQYEIIVVIDGSPDNSKEIALRYAEEYKNIHVVEQVNGGLSDARNTGLLHAKGEYIWFIDPDDFIEEKILKGIYEDLNQNNLECLWIQWREVNEDGITLPPFTKYINTPMTNTMNGVNFMRNVLSNFLYAWSFIYSRNYLFEKSLKFKKGMYYEDTDFALRSLPSIKRIKLYPKICYSYLHRNNSITHSISEQKINDILDNTTKAHKLYLESTNDSKLRLFYKKSYSAFLILALKEIAKSNNQKLVQLFKDKIKKEQIKTVFVHGHLLNKTICILYNILGSQTAYLFFHCLYTIKSNSKRT